MTGGHNVERTQSEIISLNPMHDLGHAFTRLVYTRALTMSSSGGCRTGCLKREGRLDSYGSNTTYELPIGHSGLHRNTRNGNQDDEAEQLSASAKKSLRIMNTTFDGLLGAVLGEMSMMAEQV